MKKTPCQAIPDLWFSDNRNDERAAKEACRKCPLREPCEELGWEQAHGVWGGLSELDRKKLDPARYAAAQARAKQESAEFDVVVAQVVKRLRAKRDSGNPRHGVVHLPYRSSSPPLVDGGAQDLDD